MFINEDLEIWNPVPGFEDIEASCFGRIRSRRMNWSKPRVLSLQKRKNGYLSVTLSHKFKIRSFLVHRLIARAFLRNPHKYQYVNHRNKIRDDNRIENLEWCTQSHNVKHYYDSERIARTFYGPYQFIVNGSD